MNEERNIEKMEPELIWKSKPIGHSSVLFAKIILEAAKVNQHSFDAQEAGFALEEANKDGVLVDFDSFYSRDLHVSGLLGCEKYGIEPALGHIVYLLLKYTWNDAIEWAESILEQDKSEEKDK